MKFERATVFDAQAISALILELSDPFFDSPERTGAAPFLASIGVEAVRGYLCADNFRYDVARTPSSIAGVIALRDNTHLFHLFVSPAFQGQGLARRLWDRARSAAEQAGNTNGFTVNASLNAVPVYQAFGFVCRGAVQSKHGISFQPMRRELTEHAALQRTAQG